PRSLHEENIAAVDAAPAGKRQHAARHINADHGSNTRCKRPANATHSAAQIQHDRARVKKPPALQAIDEADCCELEQDRRAQRIESDSGLGRAFSELVEAISPILRIAWVRARFMLD